MVSPLSGLSLQAPRDNTLSSALSGRQSYEQSQLNQQALKQGEQQIGRAEYDQAVQRLGVINRLAEKARSLATPQERDGFINSINPEMLKSVGIDPASIANAPRDDQGLDALIAQTGAAMPKDFRQARVQSSVQYKNGTIQQTLANGTIRVIDPSGQEVSGADAKRVIDEANQYEIQTSTQKAGSVADIKNQSDSDYAGQIKRNEKQAEADVELATRPQITAATGAAANDVESTQKLKESQKKNATALALYEQGMKSAEEALRGTETGYIAGRMPAVTANQQKAEGAIAAMAPILKNLFREAGEGTFAKDDQDRLMAMLPTTKDEPEAISAKIKNVNELVKIKLQGVATPGINGNVGRFKIEVQD